MMRMLAAGLLVLWTASVGAAEPAVPTTATGTAVESPAPRLPLEAFAQLPFVEREAISPDGTHWAGIFAIKGVQCVGILSILESKERPVITAVPDQTEVISLNWANDQNVVVGLSALRLVDADDWYITRAVGINRLTGVVTRLLWDVGGQNASEVIWWPSDEGNQVLISAQNSIYTNHVDLWPAVHRIDVTNGKDHVEVPARVGITEWAADGQGTVRAGTGYRDDARTSQVMYRSASTAATLKTVGRADMAKGEGVHAPFLFLPDADHALVVHDDARGRASIYEQDVPTQSDVRTIYSPESGEVESVVLSRDRATLLGAYTSDSHETIHWFDPALAGLQAKLQAAIPKLGVGIMSLSADRKRMLVRAGAADAPGAVFFFDVDDGVLHRLAWVNPRMEGRHLAPVRAVHYKARDGLEIEALLTTPVGRKAARLPLIVMPHGGPWAHDALTYDYWQQFLANRGYAVLQPNYRGSTGYGTEFLQRGEGQLGLAMQDDVTDAVRWAVAEGLADPARVCIVGASYGGYAAMWGIAKDPDLYRCAISIAGVSALKREVAGFANSMNVHLYTTQWTRMTPDFDAVSPINAVDRIKTPLLLIHGKKDVTVSSVQSTRMYERMRKASKDVELVLLPLADHYYSRQEDRVALLTAIEDFLGKHNPAD